MKLNVDITVLYKRLISLAPMLLFMMLITGCGRFEAETAVEALSQPTEISATVTATTIPTNQPTPTTLPAQPTATAVAVVADVATLDTTFQDTYAGMAMDYPGTWEIYEVADDVKAQSTTYATTFQSWISGPAGGGTIPEGGTKVDLAVSPSGTLTLDSAIAERRALLQSPGSDTTILAEEPVTLGNGLEGVRLLTESNFGEAAQTVTVINGHLVIFSGIGDESLLNQILQTLRPLAEADVVFEPYPVYPTDVQAIQITEGAAFAPVYSGPGDTFPQITGLQSGLALAVSGITRDAAWYQLAGCGPQNPNRPAPSCWLTSDQSVALPIRPIAPSQQPVLPAEKQAVLVVAQDMAAIHSGPDTTYPVISQLAGGFSFNIEGVSEDGNWWRLAECSSPLNELLSECWISADPDVTQALDEPIFHGPPPAGAPAVNTPLRSGTTTITELPKCFNLDSGTEGAVSNPNCEFNVHGHESPGTLVFEPIPPARFGFSGVFPEPPTPTMCAGSQHLQANTETIAPAATLYVCYQTGEGRFGYLHFLSMSNEPLAVTLEWQTFEE